MDSEKNHDAKDTTINNEETDTKNGKLEVTNLEKVATELDTPLKTPPAVNCRLTVQIIQKEF